MRWFLLCLLLLAPPAGAAEKLVGMAYTTWHRTLPWPDSWGEPLLGDYRSDDPAIIRQHAEWLSEAGVDFILVDWSNDLDYRPGITKGRPDFAMIEGATDAIFDEYRALPKHPKVAIMLGAPGKPEAFSDGRMQRKADQVYRTFLADPKRAAIYQRYNGKPLLVVYVGTPSPFQKGLPTWRDPRFTIRYMSGFLTQQRNLHTPQGVSRYGYWSWEDRGPQTYNLKKDAHPEAMVVTASWRAQHPPGTPVAARGRDNGRTFMQEWARVRAIDPAIALVVSWNEWILHEQHSVEESKDIEPSKAHGKRYLDLLAREISLYKRQTSP